MWSSTSTTSCASSAHHREKSFRQSDHDNARSSGSSCVGSDGSKRSSGSTSIVTTIRVASRTDRQQFVEGAHGGREEERDNNDLDNTHQHRHNHHHQHRQHKNRTAPAAMMESASTVPAASASAASSIPTTPTMTTPTARARRLNPPLSNSRTRQQQQLQQQQQQQHPSQLELSQMDLELVASRTWKPNCFFDMYQEDDGGLRDSRDSRVDDDTNNNSEYADFSLATEASDVIRKQHQLAVQRVVALRNARDRHEAQQRVLAAVESGGFVPTRPTKSTTKITDNIPLRYRKEEEDEEATKGAEAEAASRVGLHRVGSATPRHMRTFTVATPFSHERAVEIAQK